MQTSQSFGIHFTTRPDKAKDGKEPIYACVTVNRQRAYIALKQNVDPKNWDSGKGAAKGNKDEVKSINNYLEEVRLAIGSSYKELQLKRKMLSARAVKDLYLGAEQEVYSMSRLFTYHNESSTTDLKWSTLKHYYVTQRYLVKFLDIQFNASDIYLHQLDYKFVKDFEVFLRNHKPKDHQKPLNNNGVMKHIIRLKKMVNLALNLQWISNDPFATYKLKIQKVNREQLSELELKGIEDKKFGIERLEMVRDMFVFCCYTGLSYVDVSNLEPEHIVTGADGEQWIRTCREKTLIPVIVPLLPKALAILDKYKDNERALYDGRVFPKISNQKVNSYLKEIAHRCDITKNVTFHIARHTFATTITLSNGVPIETVSKILGHTKITTTQIYAKVVERKLKEDMQNLKAKLSKL
ncbi:site-specific integrase [Mucilaginibacter achroorhodeus]|uniref:Site-specific integrase n=1 Tax=Mucilaginibacter achroorhodeus TaxID=2599294 RepID=A0A563U1H7_9SPHI|nr:site-specific integrase [Mucilaginibacter achroorhodeus]TWR25495.1 site-specific integrase [Mucilaginibacter achroorhodeus]